MAYAIGSIIGLLLCAAFLTAIPYFGWKILGKPLTKTQTVWTFWTCFFVVLLFSIAGQNHKP
jgi:cbb3-type cytochrome oxidase subunit 1